MAEILRVRRPFSIGRKTYRRGQLVRSNEAVVKSHGHLMVSVTDEAEERVERATAAPGERRDIFARQKAAVAKAKEKEAKKAEKAAKADDSTPEKKSGGAVCDECGFEAKNAGGLSAHQRAKHGG